jgi:hypothetical protein
LRAFTPVVVRVVLGRRATKAELIQVHVSGCGSGIADLVEEFEPDGGFPDHGRAAEPQDRVASHQREANGSGTARRSNYALAVLFDITLRRSIAAHFDGLSEEQVTAFAALFGLTDHREHHAETDEDDDPEA